MKRFFVLLYRKYFKKNPPTIKDVFTPNITATCNYVERPHLEDIFDRNFSKAGVPFIVFGSSGSGKSIIINKKLKALKIKTINICCATDTTISDIVKKAYKQVSDKYDLKYITKTNQQNIQSKALISALNPNISTTMDLSSSITTNYVKEELDDYQSLAEVLGQNSITLIVDDIHKLSEKEKDRLADLIKTFINISSTYNNLKIICIGATGSAKEIVMLDNNLKNRVCELEVPYLSNEEIKTLIYNGCDLLNIEMEDNLVELIVNYSNRLASLAHNFCFDICHKKNIKKMNLRKTQLTCEDFQIAANEYINTHADTLSEIYNRAIENRIGWIILSMLSKKKSNRMYTKDILRNAKNYDDNIDDNQIVLKLSELSSDDFNILRNENNGKSFSISDPFWAAFIKIKMANDEYNEEPLVIDKHNMESILFRYLLQSIKHNIDSQTSLKQDVWSIPIENQ